MSERRHPVKVTLSDAELARLDEVRGSLSRASALRALALDRPAEHRVGEYLHREMIAGRESER